MNAIFPTSYSTLCSNALAGLLADKYDKGPVQCRLILRGVSDTYLVETRNARFIFRIYRASHRDLLQIQSEIELLLALHAAMVSVSYPVADHNGSMIQSIEAAEGIRYGVLFTYAIGKSVPILNEQQLQNLGHEMADFHTISATIQLPGRQRVIDLDTTLFQPLAMIKDAFAEDEDGYTWLLKEAGQVKKELAQYDTSAFAAGYCHFDFLPKNFHFNTEDKITFFDFDFFGHGWYVNDLMTFRQQLCLDVLFNRMTKEAANKSFTIFVEAYSQYRPLSKEEFAALPQLALGFWLFYMGFHTTHDQFYPLVFDPAHLKMRTALIRKVIDCNQELHQMYSGT